MRFRWFEHFNATLSDLCPADTPALMHGEEAAFLVWGRDGWHPASDDLHATNQERNATQVWTRQSLTFLPGSVACFPIVMQADGGTFAVKAPYRTQPILGMMDDGPSLEPKRARAAIGLAFPTFGGLQAMELTTMQHGWHDIPQSPTGRFPAPLTEAAITHASTA